LVVEEKESRGAYPNLLIGCLDKGHILNFKLHPQNKGKSPKGVLAFLHAEQGDENIISEVYIKK